MEQVSQKFQHFHTCPSLPPEYFILSDYCLGDWCYNLLPSGPVHNLFYHFRVVDLFYL